MSINNGDLQYPPNQQGNIRVKVHGRPSGHRQLETIPYIQQLIDTVFSAAHIAYSPTDTLCFKSKLSKYKNNPKYLKYIF